MKRLGIIALLLALCVIVAGCSAPSDNKNEKGTEGNTSVSVSDTTTSKAEESTKGGKESSTLETVTRSGFEGEVVTFDAADNQETTTKKSNKNNDKKEESESTSASSYETPIIPIP